MNKKNITIIAVFVLLFAAGIIAVTQETEHYIEVPETEERDDAAGLEETNEDMQDFLSLGEDSDDFIDDEYEYVPPYSGYIYIKSVPDWVQPGRWYKSNAGGIIVQEMPSRLSALRNNYALCVDYAVREDLPDELLSFYDDDKHYIETRLLYENGIQIRTQWIFRDINANPMLVAVFSNIAENAGFIEIYDDSGLISREYLFYDDGKKSRIDYKFENSTLLTSSFYEIEDNEGREKYTITYVDTFQYNRSGFLRGVDRRFYKDGVVNFAEEPVRLTLPSSIKGAIEDKLFIGARYNSLPEFFGAAGVSKDFRMVYKTDDKNRVVSQTLYDEEDKVIWIITNTWEGERIVTSVKKEGDITLTAHYDYDSEGNIVRERNLKNGILERVVRVEGAVEIEELYLDNVIVLRAVWEDGRKISEARIRNVD